jgi:hypothetical protein
MRMTGLTDTEIKRAKAAEKAYSMGDGGGFSPLTMQLFNLFSLFI